MQKLFNNSHVQTKALHSFFCLLIFLSIISIMGWYMEVTQLELSGDTDKQKQSRG